MTQIDLKPAEMMTIRKSRIEGNKLEYRFYYAVIFCAAVPFSTIFWIKDLITLNDAALKKGVFHRAHREASRVTPWVFSR